MEVQTISFYLLTQNSNYLVLIAVVAAVGVIGILGGVTGIGGVLLPPLFAFSLFPDLTSAVAVSLVIYIFMGVGGGYVFARKDRVHWPTAFLLALGAVPAAMMGARLHAFVPSYIVESILAIILIGLGAQALRRRESSPKITLRHFPFWFVLLCGLIVGFISALTGVGGPVLWIPVLLALGMQAHAVVGASIVASVPLAAGAIVGYMDYVYPHLLIACIFGVVAMCFTVFGAHISNRVDAVRLSRLVGGLLVVVGALLTLSAATAWQG